MTSLCSISQLTIYRKFAISQGISGNSSTPVNFNRRLSPCRTIISAPPAAFKKGPPTKQRRDLSQPRSRSRSRSPTYFNSTVRGPFPVEQKHTDHTLPQKIKQLTQQATQQNQNVSGLRQAILDKTVGIKSNKSKPAPSVHAILSQQTDFSSNSNNGSTCQLNQEMKSRMKSNTMSRSPVAKQPRSRSSSLTPSNRRNLSQARIENAPHLSKPRAPMDPTPVASMSMQSIELLECENNGYGKPLVTPIHKKLVIRRDGLPNIPIRRNSKVLTPCVHQPRSLAAQWCERLPTQGKLFKSNPVWNSSSNLNSVSKIPVLKKNYKLKAYSASTTSQNIPKPVGGSTGSSRCDVNKVRESRTLITKNLKDTPQEIKKPVLSVQTSIRTPSKCNLPKTSLDTVKKPFGNPPKSCEETREILLRNIAPTLPNRATIMHSSIKSYKPQLEDIKSSYLLLNKHGQAAQLKTGKTRLSTNAVLRENKARLPKLSKPIPLNEELRQKQLLQAKCKFSSKRFISDSRYDKIEGLNWISWK